MGKFYCLPAARCPCGSNFFSAVNPPAKPICPTRHLPLVLETALCNGQRSRRGRGRSSGCTAVQPQQYFLVCKYQRFNSDGARCGRLREWLILDQSQRIGFFRITKNRFRALEWQGRYAMAAVNRLVMADFACSPGAGVRRHDLDFQFLPPGYWTAVDHRMIRRSFLPMFGIYSTQQQCERFVYNLDAFMQGLLIQ